MFLKHREQRFAGRFSLSASDGQDARESAFKLVDALRKSEIDLAGSSMAEFHMSSKWGNQQLLQTNPTFTLCDEGEQAPAKGLGVLPRRLRHHLLMFLEGPWTLRSGEGTS